MAQESFASIISGENQNIEVCLKGMMWILVKVSGSKWLEIGQ